ncbi:toll/interleukin-1 receptor domain-containing protein [Frankia sp. R43]|uniref:toll/interleukin-1 receptor domain-containing protein n=1 Tax=Frankia sp. R43 TaxID=269536 RepID=UPI0006CA5847|nr:toll/interleukin-1 receptor domain-containing protein [Frankia sp. R43]
MGTGDPTTARGGPAGVDAFVSYTGADEAWALWVAAVLEAEGQRVRVQAWDSPAGTNFVAWINDQMTLAARTVAICSTAYFASHWCTLEWAGALAGNTLTPLRIEACPIPPVLATIAYRDLHGVDEPTARRRLVEAVGLAVPARVSPGFPGGPAPAPAGAIFPGGPPGQGGTPAALAGPRPPGAIRVIDADPYRLGVHRAIHLPDADDDTLPTYVDRDIDHAPTGSRARLRAAAARGGFVLLVGGSSAGKTRCAVEAIRAELADWWLIHPTDTAQITALADSPPARTVLWLDEIQTYLGGEHGLTAGTVRALLDAGLVLVGTIWPHRHRAFITPPPRHAHDDPYRWERDTLRQAAVVDVDDEFTSTEQARARAISEKDPRVQAGLDNPDDGLTQALAAAPALLRHWTSAKADEPYAWAVVTAALDAARLGVRTPLTVDLLRAAAPGYCTPRQRATASPDWFDHALAYATTPLHGATAALNPVGAGMGQLAGYTVADYLLHHTTHTREHERGPASLWTALRDHLTHPYDITLISSAALSRRIYAIAVPLLQCRADAGDWRAAYDLARLLAEAGHKKTAVNLLRAHADVGAGYVAYRLAELLAETGQYDELRARAVAGDRWAAQELALLPTESGQRHKLITRSVRRDGVWQLAELLAKAGRWKAAIHVLRFRARSRGGDGFAAWLLAQRLAQTGRRKAAVNLLRARADAGDRDIASRLAELLAETGQHDELRARADAGDQDAARRLAELLAETGQEDELRARADAGDWNAADELAELLAKAGERDELRARADAGDRSAAYRLAELLAETGQEDELRARADAGDQNAADKLAKLLAKAGERDELRARADAGDRNAAYRLAELLAETGQEDELRARADAGDQNAADKLAKLLAKAGEQDELRARADAGDRNAAYRLAELLAETGQQDELRARADAGNRNAADALAKLLAKAGDDRLLRFGFDVHGRIADEPTW